MTGAIYEKISVQETIISCLSAILDLPPITYRFVNPPIPIRDLDFEAQFEGMEIIGTGPTPELAIKDLFNKYDAL